MFFCCFFFKIKDCQVIQPRTSKSLGGKDPQTELQVGAVNEPELHKVTKLIIVSMLL